jgi:hypothetical protein
MATIAERDKALAELYLRVDCMFAFDEDIHPDAIAELKRLLRVAYERGKIARA